MKQNERRRAAVMLAALMASSSLMACGEADETTADTTDAVQTGAAETVETGETELTDNLPEMDYEGYTFRFSTRDPGWQHSLWLMEELTGDTMNDAIYNRNLAVAERFNITYDEVSYMEPDEALKTLLAGEDAFDIVSTRTPTLLELAEQGLLFQADDLPYVDLTKPWWNQSLNECLTIAGTNYLFAGAYNVTAYDNTHMLVFNKDMLTRFSLENPYTLVNEGDWTMDAFAEMISSVTVDVDGNGTMDENDSYGFLSQPKHVLPGLWIGADILTITKDENDIPRFSLPSDQKFADVFEAAYAMTWDSGAWYVNEYIRNDDMTLITMFAEEHGLFMDATGYFIASLRDMDADFGIIPYPKYNEEQNTYYSRIEGVNPSGVPVTAADVERTSVILEAMAFESLGTVLPAYYEVSLKTKMVRDEESSAMLDIIFENHVLDLGDGVWFDLLRDGLFRDMFTTNNRNLASSLASVENSVIEKLNNTVENLTK